MMLIPTLKMNASRIASLDISDSIAYGLNSHKVFTGTAGIMRSEILEALDGIEDPRNEVIR